MADEEGQDRDDGPTHGDIGPTHGDDLDSHHRPARGHGEYVFRVRFRLEPADPAITAEPATFETTVYRAADPPGEEGWLYFRDNCWRGELSDPRYFRESAADALGVPVEEVSFRELRLGADALDELKATIADDLEAFDADSVDAVLSTYLGSSIHVVGERGR